MLKELLKLTYERELELEDKLEVIHPDKRWFLEDTKKTNVQLQIKCLELLDKHRRITKINKGLH